MVQPTEVLRRPHVRTHGQRCFRSLDVLVLMPMAHVEAEYRDGVLRPTTPLRLKPGERVHVIVLRKPDPLRWDLERHARVGSAEDRALAEAGLADWANMLDREDQG